MPKALYALTAGAFGIGVTEFVIMGLLLEISSDFSVGLSCAGLLISGYALGVVVGAPLLTILLGRWERKRVLLVLMAIFTIGNLACAVSPTYSLLMVSRVLTSFAHGSFFGIGSVFASSLVAPNRKASAIAIMFTGLTLATVLGVPAGTWIGQQWGWRATFWAVTLIGVLAMAVIALLVPRSACDAQGIDWRADLRAIARLPVMLGFLTTILAFAAVFAVFTFIAPLLTEVSGAREGLVAGALLAFGLGLVAGNLAGGRLADWNLQRSIICTLTALVIVLLSMGAVLASAMASVVAAALLGAAGFATVAPLQTLILSRAIGAGESLAASLNIGAFNLGNALGAWFGGVVIDHGPGLAGLPFAAIVFPVLAILVAIVSERVEGGRKRRAAETTAC